MARGMPYLDAANSFILLFALCGGKRVYEDQKPRLSTLLTAWNVIHVSLCSAPTRLVQQYVGATENEMVLWMCIAVLHVVLGAILAIYLWRQRHAMALRQKEAALHTVAAGSSESASLHVDAPEDEQHILEVLSVQGVDPTTGFILSIYGSFFIYGVSEIVGAVWFMVRDGNDSFGHFKLVTGFIFLMPGLVSNCVNTYIHYARAT